MDTTNQDRPSTKPLDDDTNERPTENVCAAAHDSDVEAGQPVSANTPRSDQPAAPADPSADNTDAQEQPRRPSTKHAGQTETEGATERTESGFGQLGLAPPIARSVADLGYETPTPVQLQCIPHLLAGRDLLGQAQTGTGKTAAFALPLLSRIDATSKLPQVLVLTPTRELALQVAEAFQHYAQHLKDFHVAPIYGGQSYGLQVRQLQRVPQVVVGTPGRIMDHMRRGTLSLDTLRALVLDEADEMLNMGFAEDIDWIFQHTPPGRQVALFSATIPPAILKVARAHLNDPIEIRVESATATVDTIDQQHCVVTRFHKTDVLTRILELETFDAMLVFVRTKTGTTELAEKLRAQGFAADPLNGDMTQEMRERTVDRLKRGQLDILVATDVAARGLDVERVSHVVNFDIPTDPSGYVHRIGRTGRAGRAGKAILMVEPRERGMLRAIERTIRRTIPEMDTPSAAQLSASRIDRFTEQLRDTLAEEDLDFFFRLISRIAKEQELDLLNIAAALSFQLQRERPLVVKETPRVQRREREWQPERPRGQNRDYNDRGGQTRDRGGYNRDGQRPEREDRGYGRSREGSERGRDERPHREPRFEQNRDGRQEPPRFERRDAPPERTAPREPREQPRFERDRDNRPDQQPARQERDYDRGPRPFEERDRPTRPERRDRGGPDMVTHRIEVGYRDGVSPREIVGAIANESGLEGRFIGAINIQDDHATVDLPDGMPREIFAHLKRVYVCGRALQISVLDGPRSPSNRPPNDRGPRGPRPSGPRDSDRGPRKRGPRSDEGSQGGARPSPDFRRKRRD